MPDEITPKRTVEVMFKQIGDVQLPDLMLEVDAHTNFSEILLGRRAKDERELVALYAALIAHGTEIDAKGVAAMIPGLDPAQVTGAMRALETHGRLRRANECVVEFQTKHEISLLWGSGAKASSDMMSLDASRHLYNARVDPRRRTHAVGVYPTAQRHRTGNRAHEERWQVTAQLVERGGRRCLPRAAMRLRAQPAHDFEEAAASFRPERGLANMA